MRNTSKKFDLASYLTLGALALIFTFFGLLANARSKIHYKIIIPHECITSDIVCEVNGSKLMQCSFDKFKNCERIQK
jgi:hypothetical protein